VSVTPLPQANVPALTPQLPLDEVMVKLEVVPESVNVARVCVDQVPKDNNPPTELPDSKAWIVALEGRVPGACHIRQETFMQRNRSNYSLQPVHANSNKIREIRKRERGDFMRWVVVGVGVCHLPWVGT